MALAEEPLAKDGEWSYIIFASRRNNMLNRKTTGDFDGFFTIQQVADQLEIPPRTVLWQVLNGYLSGARKFGEGKRGIWLIPQSAIDNYASPKKGRRPAVGRKDRK